MSKAFAIIGLMLLAAACAPADRVAVPANGVIQLSEEFTGAFALTSHEGAPVETADLKGKVGVIYFGFASCPDVCPAALGTLSAALNLLDEKDLAQLQPLFVTVDPERDTQDALKARLAHDDRILGLTGSQEEIEAAKKAFKVYAEREDLPGSALGYTVNHISLFYILDRQGRLTVALRDSLTPPQLAEMLRRSLRKGSPK